MAQQELFIKNMVCERCIWVAQIELGRAVIDGPSADLFRIEPALERHGFALLTGKTAQVVNQVKTLIIDLIQSGRIADLHITLSVDLQQAQGDLLKFRQSLDYYETTGLRQSNELISTARRLVDSLLSGGRAGAGSH